MSDAQQTPIVKRRTSFGRFAGIVAVFVLAGPPVGGLAATTLLAAATASSELVDAGLAGGGLEGWVAKARVFSQAMTLGLAYGLPLSYLFGAVPALLVGVATAGWDARRGAISPAVALVAALLLGGLVALAQTASSGPLETEVVALAATFLAHLSAAAACWLVARAIFGRGGSE